MISSVHKTLVMELMSGMSGRFPVLTHLEYDATDPFAVTASFSHEGRLLAQWRLDRQMLAEGLLGPVGEGDVRLRPQSTGVWHELRLELFGDAHPDGGRHHAVILAWAPAVASFLEETYEVVELGSETVGVDDFLAEVIGNA